MNAYKPSLINALVLISLSLWGYFSSATPSVTALIPTFVGVALLFCSKGVKSENKVIAHIAVVLTLLILAGLVMPLKGALGREDNVAIFRIVVMIASTIFAMVYFIKSFKDARKKRENSN